MTTKTVHFTIGDEFGILLMQIAQEHLLYTLNPQKAIDTITGSLVGCPLDIALKILKGEKVLPVNVKTQEVICVDRKDKIHDLFPKLELRDWYKRKHKEIGNVGRNIHHSIEILMNEIANGNGRFELDVDYKSLFSFINNNNKDQLLDEIKENEKVREISDIIRITKNYLDTTYKTWAVMEWMESSFPEEFSMWENDNEMRDVLDHLITEKHVVVGMVLTQLSLFLNADYSIFEAERKKTKDNLTNFMEAQKEIDINLKKGIKPVDIMSNYSAGWLSPEGDYYALNGEIANFLHNQIVDALMSKGIIPDGEINGDKWLEQQGWVKITDNNINFGGCLNTKQNKKNVHMTDIQKKMIYEYISNCHNSIVRAGWRMEKISATRFRDTDNLMLAKNYFSFD